MQFISATKQLESLLIDKHAGSVKRNIFFLLYKNNTKLCKYVICSVLGRYICGVIYTCIFRFLMQTVNYSTLDQILIYYTQNSVIENVIQP